MHSEVYPYFLILCCFGGLLLGYLTFEVRIFQKKKRWPWDKK